MKNKDGLPVAFVHFTYRPWCAERYYCQGLDQTANSDIRCAAPGSTLQHCPRLAWQAGARTPRSPLS
jgi:hypothetical protein